MAKELNDSADIELLIRLFYKKILADDLLAPFFTQTDFEHHIPVMVNFWENALFYTGGYMGNPMESHKKMHILFSFSNEHFDRWLTIFNSSVDELFKGVNAMMIKHKAFSIATVMKLKLLEKKQESDQQES